MRRDYHNWYSTRLDRHMELLTYGHAGWPVLVFPTARGRFFDYENNGMIQALTPKIDAGELTVFCVDSVDAESWYNGSIHPHERVRRQVAYEEYILFEVVPLMRGANTGQQIGVTGCALGAYHGLNFALRHPDIASASICMSGCFDMRPFMDGYFDNDFYFNSPIDYLPNMNDRWFLDRYQTMKFILAAGNGDVCLSENLRIGDIFDRKNIPHWLDIWTDGEPADWPLWQRMAAKFF